MLDSTGDHLLIQTKFLKNLFPSVLDRYFEIVLCCCKPIKLNDLTLIVPLFFFRDFFEEARMKFQTNRISHNIMSKVYEMHIIVKVIDYTIE